LQEGKEEWLSKRTMEDLLEERTIEGKRRLSIRQEKRKGLFYLTCGRLKYCITEKGVFLKKEKTA
jgi:hypothetical protein